MVTGQNVGSFSFFLLCTVAKKENNSALLNRVQPEIKHILDFWWEKSHIVQDCLRQKTWYMFDSKPDTT